MSRVQELIDHTDQRKESFTIIKDHLDKISRPLIVETGCIRQDNDWGAGCSTLIWDAYIAESGPGARFLSIDIDPVNVKFAQSRVKRPTSIVCSDSVKYLKTLSNILVSLDCSIDVLYLDSYDLEEGTEHESALHHMFELLAASKALSRGALVMIDDNPPEDKGKGKYIEQYMEKLNVSPVYHGYQHIWRWE